MDRLFQFVASNAVAAMGLALCAAAAARLFRRAPLTRALWVLVLLKLITPPLWTVPISLPAAPTLTVANTTIAADPVDEAVAIADEPADPDLGSPAATEIASPVSTPPEALAIRHPAAPSPFPWATLLVLLWLAGASACAALILRSTLRVRWIIRQSVSAPLAIRRRAAELARLMGLARPPQILFARGALPPMLCATGVHRRIILPASLWSRLDDDQQDTVLVHELAHLRHGDHWVRRLELLAAVLYWWHPAVWWSRSQLRESSEQCCDAWVVWALPRLSRSYAAALVETVDFISLSPPALPVLASGMGQFTDLKRRLVMIQQANAPRALSRPGYTALFSLAGLLLPLAPSFAQEAPPAPPAPPAPRAVPVQPAPEAYAPVDPAPAPKANILIAPAPFAYSEVEEQDASPKSDQNRAQVERARAQVERLRTQLREAERRLSDLQRNAGGTDADRSRADSERARAREMAEAQKERAREMAQAQKERARDMARAAVDRARAQEDRARAQQDRARAMEERKRVTTDFQFQNENQNRDQNNNDGVSPKPRVNVQTRNQPQRTEEYVKAGARLRAAGGDNAGLERRLDQMEKQLDELVGQLRQMKQQVSKPAPRNELQRQ